MVFNDDSKKQSRWLNRGLLVSWNEAGKGGKDEGGETEVAARMVHRKLCILGNAASCLNSSLEWDEVYVYDE